MLKCSKLVTLGALLGTLTACQSWDDPFMVDSTAHDDADIFIFDIDDVRAMEPQGSEFTKGLRAGYLELVDGQWAGFDRSEAAHFGRKAVASAKGLNVQPDMVTLRALGDEDQAEFGAAYARLIAAMDAGARSASPSTAATAQVSYDCWLEAVANNDDASAARCKAAFEAAMTDLERDLASSIGNVYVVFFAWDSATISPVSIETIQAAAGDFTNGEGAKLILAGHADTSGTKAYNATLSEQRARSVAASLAELGVAGDQIDVSWFGEDQLSVPTADGVREPKNRRVEIEIQ